MKLSLKVIFDYFTKTHFGKQDIKYTGSTVYAVRRVLRKSAFYTSSFCEASK